MFTRFIILVVIIECRAAATIQIMILNGSAGYEKSTVVGVAWTEDGVSAMSGRQ